MFYLILPDIRSCHNVGAMFRTADAFGIDKLYLVGYTACPPKPQIDKVSLGAETWMPWEYRKDLKRLLVSLKKKGFYVVGLEKTNTSEQLSVISKQLTEKDIVLIVGNEVDGIEKGILDICDEIIEIPMLGSKESLNVSVATGVVLYSLIK